MGPKDIWIKNQHIQRKPLYFEILPANSLSKVSKSDFLRQESSK